MSTDTATELVSGVIPVLATPFTVTGEVDFASYERLVDHIMSTGVTATLMFGLASEFHKLSDWECSELTQLLTSRSATRGDFVSIVSVTDHATEIAVETAKNAERAGAGAINILPPFFLSPSPSAVINHVRAVLAAVEIPVIIQYAPAQTGTSLDPKMVGALAAEFENLTHIKVESSPPGRFIDLLNAQGLRSLVGYAGVQLPDALDRGAVGVQPGCSITEVYQHIWDPWTANDRVTLRERHEALLPHISYWMQSVELIIQIEKTILHRRGIIDSEYCRAPGWQLDDIERSYIDHILTSYAPILGDGRQGTH